MPKTNDKRKRDSANLSHMNIQIGCKHILLKHNKSRNPIDKFRNKNITRDLVESKKELKLFRIEIDKFGFTNGDELIGDKFSEIALSISECTSAQ